MTHPQLTCALTCLDCCVKLRISTGEHEACFVVLFVCLAEQLDTVLQGPFCLTIATVAMHPAWQAGPGGSAWLLVERVQERVEGCM